jgi:UDP-N-acetylmuramate dehydrogenase
MKKIKIDLSRFSSIKIGPKTEIFLIEDKTEIKKEFFIIGRGSNLLISSNPPPIAILSKKFDYIKLKEDELIVGGATSLNKIVSFCKKYNLGGLEFLSKIPGSVGGAIKMNAGVKKFEIKNILKEIKTEEKTISVTSLKMDYRKTEIKNTVLEAVFKIKKGFSYKLYKNFIALRNNQPKAPSAGSTFKNPPQDYAGKLLEKVGLKGFKYKNMAFSNIHANFLINTGKGKFEEAIFLIELAKKRVFEEFGIKLEEEIIVI